MYIFQTHTPHNFSCTQSTTPLLTSHFLSHTHNLTIEQDETTQHNTGKNEVMVYDGSSPVFH